MTQHWTRRRFLVAAGGVAVVGLGAACSSDDDPTAASTPSTTTTSTPTDLPTNDEAELTRMFDPIFEPHDERVTRIGLYDLSQGFVRDDAGTHLAIYIEPIDPDGEGWDTTRYVESIVPVMEACTPYIFDTWSGIESMDVCQQPPQSVAPEPEPPIVTQVQLGRADYHLIGWGDLELADLIAASLRSPETARARVDDEVEDHPLWTAAEAAALERV